jgi:hypothetical protein
LSIAEVSARMILPVGVVRVLVGDLTAAGAVMVGTSATPDAATDITLLERLLDGIRAL